MKAWKRLSINTAMIKVHRRLVSERYSIFSNLHILRRRGRFFFFWRRYSAYKHRRRRRKFLAEVMGSYTLKARAFARIKLFNYISNKLTTVVGHYEISHKRAAEAYAKIRYVWRLNNLRRAIFRLKILKTFCT